MFKDTLLWINLSVSLFSSSSPVQAIILSRDWYFHQLDASLLSVFFILVLILSSSNNYLRRSYLYLKTFSEIDAGILNFEEVLNSEYFWILVTEREQLKSIISCSENEVIGVHDSLYRIYWIIADLIHLLLILHIPHYQVLIDPY